MQHFRFEGDLRDSNGQVVQRAGFMPLASNNPGLGTAWVQGVPVTVPTGNLTLERAMQAHTEYLQMDKENREKVELLARGQFDGDVQGTLQQLAMEIMGVQRAITSDMTAFPVKQNLEDQARSLVPEDTPVRNMLPRIPGAGLAVVWIQAVSLGGGWGTLYDQPGGGSAAPLFYAETGSPAERSTVYQSKTAAYKLMGTLGKVTGFAMAAGANFQDQLAREKDFALRNMFINEEIALINANSTSTTYPWGDGSNALAFDGLMNLVTTANGTPSSQVQTGVGALTTAHIDNQLADIWNQGGSDLWILINRQEAQSLVTLMQATGTIRRLEVVDAGNSEIGFRVARYIHPITGQPARVIVSRNQLAGSMLFGANVDPEGKPAAAVSVLPQVPVQTAPESPQQVQGYAVTDLARPLDASDSHPFMISVYETVLLHNSKVFAKSTGVTAAS